MILEETTLPEEEKKIHEHIIRKEFGEYIQPIFLDYARDVAIDRALPDIRDGLKPIHRRILQTMNDLGLHPNGQYRKSARTVGSCIGIYSPHGDVSAYDALINLAQDFKMRYPLVDVHGNQGSIDGDPAAAMRYTESKLSKYGELMLQDLNKDTVDMQPNYDESATEATVLPGMFCNLLLNGSSGIAVGVSTSFVPHCAKDVYKALDRMIRDILDGKETSIDTLIRIIKAPDFPTGGVIVDLDKVHDAYHTGHGKVVIRSKFHVDTYAKNKERIIITEIPYKVNKAKLVEQINALKLDGTISDIAEVRDETNREGIRICIDLKKGAKTDWIINVLLKKTNMQSSVPMNHIALVNGHPKEGLSLKDILENFLEHCIEVTRRATVFDLGKASKRMHIIKGLVFAMPYMDDIYKANKEAGSKKDAIKAVKDIISVDDVQAEVIIDLHFWNMNKDSIDKLQSEYDDLKNFISHCDKVLSDDMVLLAETQKRLKEIANKYFKKDERLTDISDEKTGSLDIRDCIQEEDIVIMYTHNGMIKAVKLSDYGTQKRYGKGSVLKTRDDDFVEKIITLTTKDNLVFITNTGKSYVLPAYEIQISSKNAMARYVTNFISLEDGEKIINVISIKQDDENKSLFFVTANGLAKRLAVNDLPKTSTGAKIISFKKNDYLVDCSVVRDNDEILMISSNGFGFRIPVSTIRIMGRSACGSITMRFKNAEDRVVSATHINSDDDIVCIISKGGWAKKVLMKNLPARINKGGKGLIAYKTDDISGPVLSVHRVGNSDTMIVVTNEGMIIRTPVSDIPVRKTISRGVHIIKLSEGDTVAGVTKAVQSEVKET